MRALRSTTLLLSALLATATTAHADDSLARAAALYDQGRRAFDLGAFADAIASWKASYMLSSAPPLLFNVAQAYRLSGDCARANRFYLSYQRVEPQPANADELAAAMAKCAGVEPASGDGASGDGEPRAPTIATPPPVPIRSHAPGAHLRFAGVVAVGVGGAAGVASMIYGLRAREHASVIASQPAGTPWTGELVDTQGAGRAAQTRARVFGVVSAAAIVTGATMWWFGRHRAHVRLDVAITPERGEASVTCAF